ncbi:hypothetical protein MKX01_025654 [Papaver californicum]|nr:hypothetical protein MKX01_025654 [Papaver californicum]
MFFLDNHLFKLFCLLGRKSVKRELLFEGVRENNSIKRIENMQKPSGCNSKEHLLPDQGVPSKVALEAGQQKFSLQYEACSQGVLLDPVFNKQKLEHGSPLKETTIREVTHLQFQEPSTPIQGSLPLVEMKRKTPENFTCSSPQPQQQSYILLNSVCQVPCSDATNFKQHCEVRKHKNKVEELKHLKNCEDKKELGPVWCDICSVPCMDRSHVACLSTFNKAMRGKGVEIENRMENGRGDYSPSALL